MRCSKGLKFRAWVALSISYVALCSIAHADNQTLAPQTQTANKADTSLVDQQKYADKVYWPMMPGDSLSQLAESLYPESPILKERFIKKTLSLSRALDINVQPNEVFKSSGLLIIPNEKAVKELTHRIRKSEEIKQQEEKLRLSYQLKTRPIEAAPSLTPPKVATPSVASQPTETAETAVAQTLPQDNVQTPSLQSQAAVVEAPPPAVEATKPAAQVAAPASLPTPKTKVLAPTSTAEKTSAPSINLPDITLPEIQLPNINWQSYWQAAAQQLSAWYQSGVVLVKRANNAALDLKEEYLHKNFSQVMHDYRLRNIALVSVLGVVFLVLWLLHKRRARKQRNLLSMIEDTINPEAEFVVEIPQQKLEEVHPSINTAEPALTQVYDQRNYH